MTIFVCDYYWGLWIKAGSWDKFSVFSFLLCILVIPLRSPFGGTAGFLRTPLRGVDLTRPDLSHSWLAQVFFIQSFAQGLPNLLLHGLRFYLSGPVLPGFLFQVFFRIIVY